MNGVRLSQPLRRRLSQQKLGSGALQIQLLPAQHAFLSFQRHPDLTFRNPLFSTVGFHLYVQFKEQNKRTHKIETDTEDRLVVAREQEVGGWRGKVKELRRTHGSLKTVTGMLSPAQGTVRSIATTMCGAGWVLGTSGGTL